MPTAFESAQLNLKLFEMRRDPVLREAREWFLREFTPRTFEELLGTMQGPRNAWCRMVVGYWDMAASLVTFDAIDAEMFRAAHGEMTAVVSKLYPFLPQLREKFDTPNFFAHAERVVVGMPDGKELLAKMRDQFLKMRPPEETLSKAG